MSYRKGFTLWFTGLSGAGKSTLAGHLAKELRQRGLNVEILDGDEVRTNLSKGLGFSKEDRDTNIKRIGYVCKLLTRNGVVAISAAISPYREIRDHNRSEIGNFIEVYVECSIEALTRRDVKGLYKKALAGEIQNFTGVSDPYEAPLKPEIAVNSERQSEQESLKAILDYLEQHGWIPGAAASPKLATCGCRHYIPGNKRQVTGDRSAGTKRADHPMTAELSPKEIDTLNGRFERAHPVEIIRWAAETFRPDVALTSSFGADSAAIIHMALQADPRISVRTVDTGFLFPETLQLTEALRRRWTLNLTVFRTKLSDEEIARLKREHPTKPVDERFCCGAYKREATERALAGLRCWIAGLMREEAVTRRHTPIVERLSSGLVKVAPIAAWTSKQIYDYMRERDLPYHPLWAKGYTSIGCAFHTQKPVDPNDSRSGRWAGQTKTECGIHDIGKNQKTEGSKQ